MRHIAIAGALVCLVLISAVGSLGQTTWTKSSKNPIFSIYNGGLNNPVGTKYALEPEILYDSTTGVYRMWYTSLSFGYGTALAINGAMSLNGLDWFVQNDGPALDVAASAGTFDATVRFPKVVRQGNSYAMYYTGTDANGKGSIGLATSEDGIHFSRQGTSPILAGDTHFGWDGGGVSFQEVRKEDSVYYMWYSGGNGAESGIGLARSSDGVTWVKDSLNPVLFPTLDSEKPYVMAPSVVKVGGLYYMFYVAGPYESRSVFFAYSEDKVHWTRGTGGPILVGGSQPWEGSTIGGLEVIFTGGQFRMWYSAITATGQWEIGYATSPMVTLNVAQPLVSPTVAALSQNFPNPFNPATTIEYTVAGGSGAGSPVKLVVFDELGREVAVLVNEKQAPGTHRVVFDASRFASGVYYYRLENGGTVQVRSMTLVK